MTVYTHDGQILHHNDCTYCQHRKKYPKFFKKIYELEVCEITGVQIPAPKEHILRLCDMYQQNNCECESCTKPIEYTGEVKQLFDAKAPVVIHKHHLVDRLDKQEEMC
jgi:hypothetical protein